MKKQLIGVCFILLIAVLAFYGYSYFQRTEISDKIFEHSLPNASIKADGKTIQTAQGSYCWSALAQSRCVDMIGPIDIVKFHKVKPTVLKANEVIRVHYDQVPKKDSVGVNLWTENVPIEVKIENNQIIAPKEKGTYVYSLYGTWKKGTSSQVFTIEVQ